MACRVHCGSRCVTRARQIRLEKSYNRDTMYVLLNLEIMDTSLWCGNVCNSPHSVERVCVGCYAAP